MARVSPARRGARGAEAPVLGLVPNESERRSPLPPFHVPEGAKDDAPATSFSPDATVGLAHGAEATAAPAADTGMDIDTDPIPAVAAPTPPNTDIDVSPQKKRRRSRGPRYDADRNAYYASKDRKTTDDPANQGGVDARGEDRGGA